MTLKAHRGRCAHCGHDHDAARKMAEYRALATQPPSPPAQVGTSGASAEVSRLAEALLMDAKDSVEDYRDGKEFGAHDRKLIGRLKAALAAMAYPAAKVGTEDADAQATREPTKIGTQIAQAEFLKRWDEAAQRKCDESVTPEFLRWLQDEAYREGVSANVAWNAGVAWARANLIAPQPPEAMAPINGDKGVAGWLTVCGPTTGCGVQYAGNLAQCPNCGKANFGRPAGTTVILSGITTPAMAPAAPVAAVGEDYMRAHPDVMLNAYKVEKRERARLATELQNCESRIREQRAEINRLAAPQPRSSPLTEEKAAQPDPEKVMELADEYANEASWTGYYSDNGDAKNGAIQRRDAAREALRAYVARGTI